MQRLSNDMKNRSVEVDRKQLIDALEKNHEQHLNDYEEALEGYKEELLARVTEAYDKVIAELPNKRAEEVERIMALELDDILEQEHRIPIIEAEWVTMPVPECHSKEYITAIEMAEWDVNPTLTLTYMEFQCFIRDIWDWSEDFLNTTALYMNKAK